LYKSDGQAIKSEVYPREVRGLNDGVYDKMPVNVVELTMIHACKHCRIDDDIRPENIAELAMIHACKHRRIDDDIVPVNIADLTMMQCL
jgi:hypothetical protein